MPLSPMIDISVTMYKKPRENIASFVRLGISIICDSRICEVRQEINSDLGVTSKCIIVGFKLC